MQRQTNSLGWYFKFAECSASRRIFQHMHYDNWLCRSRLVQKGYNGKGILCREYNYCFITRHECAFWADSSTMVKESLLMDLKVEHGKITKFADQIPMDKGRREPYAKTTANRRALHEVAWVTYAWTPFPTASPDQHRNALPKADPWDLK